MSTLPIHVAIREQLTQFRETNTIPNLLFHGAVGVGKRTLVQQFLDELYTREQRKSLVMCEDCAHGRGIKFIRDDLKFFAKTNIHSEGGQVFKSIVLLHADELTMDAQSALRRCIEQFSHTTRFFLVAENKCALMKPILSRFCEVYVSTPQWNGKPIDLHRYHLDRCFPWAQFKRVHLDNLKRELRENPPTTPWACMDRSDAWYQLGFSAMDLLALIEAGEVVQPVPLEQLMLFHNARREFHHEPLFMSFILHSLFCVSLNTPLNNISFI